MESVKIVLAIDWADTSNFAQDKKMHVSHSPFETAQCFDKLSTRLLRANGKLINPLEPVRAEEARAELVEALRRLEARSARG